MSFLEDSSASLQDVLAFIDAYYGDTGDAAIPIVVKQRTKMPDNVVEPRKRRSQSYRTREEIQRLRCEATALETRIAELKGSLDNRCEQQLMALAALNFRAHRSKSWTKIALYEYRSRQDSERVNKKLKALLDKQLRIIQASEKAFGAFTPQEISLVFDSQRAMGSQNRAMDEIQIMASLGDRLQQLELNADKVVDRSIVDLTNSIRQGDSSSGVFYESCSCLTLPMSMDFAESILNRIYTHKAAKPNATKLDQDVKTTKTKRFALEHQNYELLSQARMRVLDRSNGAAFVRSTLISYPSEHLSFVEESMFVLVPPSESQGTTSDPVLIAWFKIQAQRHNVPSTIEKQRELDLLQGSFVRWSGAQEAQHVRRLKSCLCEDTLTAHH